MINIPWSKAPEISFELYARCEPPAEADAVTIKNLVRQAGIKEISTDVLSQSYALLVARKAGRLVGSLRQVNRLSKIVRYEWGDYPQAISCCEIGSVVVVPEARGAGIARGMIELITYLYDIQNFLPYAVCNPAGEVAFRACGYEEVGAIPDRNRKVLAYPPKTDWFLHGQWQEGLNMQPAFAAALAEHVPGMIANTSSTPIA